MIVLKKIIITIIIMGLAIIAILFIFMPNFSSKEQTVGGDDDPQATAMASSRYVFNEDSAYTFCAKQCKFGPRVMNTAEHDSCGAWIKRKFEQYGCYVESQKANLKAYDGTMLRSENIIARFNPQLSPRLLICAHWDTRPWADNDPDANNHRKPVIGANDGASGVAVMIELARMLHAIADSVDIPIGIDFVCFDAEDYGTPQWAEGEDDPLSWALGSQYWSKRVSENMHEENNNYIYGILLDMVGGEGAKFYQEGMSMKFAPERVNEVWQAANTAGYGSFFVNEVGGYVTDDHIPVNEIACIPCIDIVPYYPNNRQSSFGSTWHTVDDTMNNISKKTLKAVGQTLAYLISSY